MDNTYSFLDQDGLFNMDVSAPAEGEQQPRGVAARPQQRAAPVPLPPSPHQSSGGAGGMMTADAGNNGLLEALDSIARALAYTEKRVASAESRLLAALQREEEPRKQRGAQSSSWGGLFGVFGATVAFFVIVALIFSWCRSRGAQSAQMTLPPPPYVYSGTVPYTMRAPTTPMLFPSGAAASGIGPPPATFLS